MDGRSPLAAALPLRPTHAVVDLTAIRQNARAVRGLLSPGTCLWAVVKADAYGHGAEAVAQALQGEVDGLCVAIPQEALRLREKGCSLPILVLGPVDAQEAAALVQAGVSLTVAGTEGLVAAVEAARRTARRVRVHVKVDTGMGRLGRDPQGAEALLEEALSYPEVELEGVYSHLSSADEDPPFTRRQIQVFREWMAWVRPRLPKGVRFHLANSAGTLGYPEAHLDMVRVGIALYGYGAAAQAGVRLSPAMSLVSRVSFVKRVPPGTPISYGHAHITSGPRVIATVPAGYADGVRRSLTGLTVWAAGRQVPVVGRVTMDQLMVEGPLDWTVAVGDPVVLMGEAPGHACWADTWARHLGTIPYEVLTGLSARVPRVYVSSPEAGR
jgi:alanine racemase